MISYFVTGLLIAFFVLGAGAVVVTCRHLLIGKTNAAVVRQFDLQAFAVVLDVEDEAYLKSMLSECSFTRLKRKRIRLAFRYVNRLSTNMAGILRIRKTEWLLASRNAEFNSAASTASDLAGRIRVQCLIAYSELSLEFLFPTHQFTATELIGDYRSLKAVLAEMRKMAAGSQLAAVPVI
jgi:hypothetical protein